MKIAQVAPLVESVPPRLYGGTERVVASLTEEMVAMGHDVTLFASGDSITSATLAPMRDQALRLDPSVRDWIAIYYRMVELIYRRKDEFDVLHFHIDYFPLSLFSRQNVPFVTTLHGRLDLPEAATEASLVTLELPDPVELLVHKLRGTVRWPDTRGADADPAYAGTPLAERRVYVLPLPAGIPAGAFDSGIKVYRDPRPIS